jgi:hypothetical protein
MEENSQRKYEQLIKRRMQEAKEDGVAFVPPREILRAGNMIVSNQAGIGGGGGGGPTKLGSVPIVEENNQ